jgi:hypothetical protein
MAEAMTLVYHFQSLIAGLGLWYLMPLSTIFQQYFSYIMAVSFIGGGNLSTRRKPLTCRKLLTSFIT